MKKIILFIFIINFFLHVNVYPQNKHKENNLAILWTSGDKEVAEKMVFMYAYHMKKEWDNLVLIVWGPSSKLLSKDKSLQNYIAKLQKVGVKIVACKACADMYKVTNKLKKLNIEVKYMGKPLTQYLKSNWKILSF